VEDIMLKSAIAALFVSTMLGAPAFAGAITFDFGNAGTLGSQTSTSQTVNGAGIFSGGGAVTFTNSGVSVSAEAFGGRQFNCSGDHCLNSTFVTQKPGSFGPGETGIGESGSQNSQTDADREVVAGTYLVLNNISAIAHGYTASELILESLQAGEGIDIYGLSTMGSTLDVSKLGAGNLLATLIGCSAPGCTGGVTQTADLQNWNYFVLTTIPSNAGGSGSNDFVLSEDIVSSVPEPVTLSLFGAGLLGMGALRRRKTNKAV
jgi:hypothetical protein